ncbi:hypothetical protein HDU77_010235 [Chytriomyces hyalinus]|nr:hypothetical protein HDU77_010235 [Chytriomyces hyalinus]
MFFLAITSTLAAAHDTKFVSGPLSLGISMELQHVRSTEPKLSRRSIITERDPALSSNASSALTSFESGSSYFATVRIGTPGQLFSLLVDTGSALTWFPSSSCDSNCGHMSQEFRSDLSSTFLSTASSRDIHYGTGYVRGRLITDAIEWAGFSAKKQPFLLVSEQSPEVIAIFNDTGDGILGLTYQDGLNSTTSHETVIYSIFQENQNLLPLFSMWLNPSSVTKQRDSNGGKLIVGGVDETLYNGNFTFIPIFPVAVDGSVSGSYYWTVAARSIGIRGSVSVPAVSATAVIIDSGTSGMFVDESTLKNLVLAFSVNYPGAFQLDPATNLYMVSCKLVGKLPDIIFNLGDNIPFPISSANYIVGSGVPGKCALYILSKTDRRGAVTVWILGSVFLQSYYAIYDMGNQQVGFASSADGNTPGKGTPLTLESLKAGGGVGVTDAAPRTSNAYAVSCFLALGKSKSAKTRNGDAENLKQEFGKLLSPIKMKVSALAAAAVIAASVSALDSGVGIDDGAIPIYARTRSYSHGAIAAQTKALQYRYSSPATSLSQSLAQISIGDAIPLINYGSNSFFVRLRIGSNKQEFSLDIDTGSSFMWVPSVSCNPCAGSNPRFNYSKSASFKNLNNFTVHKLQYGTGSVNGFDGQDTVQWDTYTIENQPLLVTTSQDSVMRMALGTYGDGILGLAFEDGLKQGFHETIMYNLASKNMLPQNIFSIWMNQSDTGTETAPSSSSGQLVLGAPHTSLYWGSFKFFPVVPIPGYNRDGSSTKAYYWAIKASGLSVGVRNSLPAPAGTIMVIDSGTSMMTIEHASHTELLRVLKETGQEIIKRPDGTQHVNCSTVKTLPSISFNIGDSIPFVFSFSDYILPDPKGGDDCTLGFQPFTASLGDGGPNLWIVGSIFLQKYCTVFDLENEQVGFALASDGFTAANGTPLDLATLLANSKNNEAGKTSGEMKRPRYPDASVLLALFLLFYSCI